MVPCNSKEICVIRSQTDEVSTSLAGYYSDFFKEKKTGPLAIMSCMYSRGKGKSTLAQFLQNCKLKIIKTYGKNRVEAANPK